MAKTRPISPSGGSTITTTTVRSGPGGRKYTTRIEKSQPKYSFKVTTNTTAQSAIPEEVELDGKHFARWPGILKILQIVSKTNFFKKIDLDHSSYRRRKVNF